MLLEDHSIFLGKIIEEVFRQPKDLSMQREKYERMKGIVIGLLEFSVDKRSSVTDVLGIL